MLDGARVTAAIAPLMQWGAAEKRDGEGNDLMNDKICRREIGGKKLNEGDGGGDARLAREHFFIKVSSH